MARRLPFCGFFFPSCIIVRTLQEQEKKMQITENIHALKIPFTIHTGPGKTMERFVFSYLIYGRRICLIDCGVAGSKGVIFDYIRETGRDPMEIETAVVTHAHPDHMGGARSIKKETGCGIIAHEEDAPWVEDVERQFDERPVPGFRSLVEGPVGVDLKVRDGDILQFDDGTSLGIVHTPGHSRGHICLFHAGEGALFSGDAIPSAGSLPIYEDVSASVRSIKKLKALTAVRVLCPAWDEPRFGQAAYEAMDEGLRYLQHVHELVLAQKKAFPSWTATEIAAKVLGSLGLPDTSLPPIVVKSFESHLQSFDRPGLLED
jgi:hydroxyacylglutathione hydrolase